VRHFADASLDGWWLLMESQLRIGLKAVVLELAPAFCGVRDDHLGQRFEVKRQ